MAKITDISSEQLLKIDSLQPKVIKKTFGRREDNVELHIYDINDNLLYSENNFTDYILDEPEEISPSTPLIATTKEPRIVKPDAKGAGEREYIPGPNGSREGYYFNTGEQMVWVTAKPSPSTGVKPELPSHIHIDPIHILNDRAYIAGKYKIRLNIQRNKVFNLDSNSFNIKEISSTRREIRSITPLINNSEFDKAINLFISEIETSSYFKGIILNFGSNINIVGINILLNKNSNKHELLIKTLDPLPSSITTNSTFKIVEAVIDPISMTVDLGEPDFLDEGDVIPLQGPNFKIDVRLNNSVPSSYKNYNELLTYSATSSYQHLLNQLENKEIPQINYDYIRPISSSTETTDVPYHFENFIHFGSAVERLKNFEYKLSLIELYNRQIGEIENITTTTPTVVLNNKETLVAKKTKLIKGFDGYEQFLYFETGSNIFSWPKITSASKPLLHSISSSTALTWLGSENSNNSYYGGQLLSASLFDFGNEYGLINLVPKHIVDNVDNDFYQTFTHMIGQHFDHIWTHIKHITEINNTHHTQGVSKDLVYFTLKSLGLETFDQFENANLIEYILGEGSTGSLHYDTPKNQSLVTASMSSIPKGDITKEVWKRLYHNAPYLLKTKGTERGLRALMSCYGIPSTILNVKEYGGPVKDKTKYKTFSYDKSSLSLHGSSSNNGYFLKTGWHSSETEKFTTTEESNQNAKTVAFRIKPTRSNNQYHLFTLSGSSNSNNGRYHPHLILTPYVGNDISSSGDSTQYGKLDLYTGSALLASTNNFPIYNGDFWNIFIGREVDESKGKYLHFSSNYYAGTMKFGAYQSNHLKNVTYHTSSFDLEGIGIGTQTIKKAWGNDNLGTTPEGADYVYFCGVETNGSVGYELVDTLGYTGSLQEVKYYFPSASKDILNPKTLEIQALDPFIYAGNTTSSAFNDLIFRSPLGSNLVESSQTINLLSHHPNSGVEYILKSSISSSGSSIKYKEIIETHHLPTPDTVGISMTSEKVRMDEGSIDDDILSHLRKSEVSVLDRQPQDFEDLGVFFSPTTEINEEIIYNMGAFRLDDFIGSPLPTAQTASLYTDLRHLRRDYFKRVKTKFNYWDYIKTIQYIDHTLFKLIEQWVPMKANLKTGLLIEPHYLERNKFPRELPVIDDGQTMISGSYNTFEFQLDPERAFTIDGGVGGGSVTTTNNFKTHGHKTGSNYYRLEQGTNFTINISNPNDIGPHNVKTAYVLDEEQNIAQAPIQPFSGSKSDKYIPYKSSTLLGNATKGRGSNKYYKFGTHHFITKYSS